MIPRLFWALGTLQFWRGKSLEGFFLPGQGWKHTAGYVAIEHGRGTATEKGHVLDCVTSAGERAFSRPLVFKQRDKHGEEGQPETHPLPLSIPSNRRRYEDGVRHVGSQPH